MFTYTVMSNQTTDAMEIVGRTGNITNAKKIAFDYAFQYGRAEIHMRDTTDKWQFVRNGDTVKVTA